MRQLLTRVTSCPHGRSLRAGFQSAFAHSFGVSKEPKILRAYNGAMSVPRFFISPSVTALSTGARFALPESAAHHAARVLRLGEGSAVTLFDGLGGEYSGVIISVGGGVQVKLSAFDPVERETPFAVDLVQGVSSADRMDFTVQKAVELGAAAIRPVITDRSVVKLSGERAAKRVLHWQQIVIAACEQCGRNRVPTVLPIQALDQYFASCLAQREPDGQRWLLSPRADEKLRSRARPDGRVTLLIGPEGGFTEGEEAAARLAGFAALSLGRRVLRTETAALGTLAAISALWED
jgi:16S rRNA (uracil1498-N3)-methyltransferase